jgi:hypothetical protein
LLPLFNLTCSATSLAPLPVILGKLSSVSVSNIFEPFVLPKSQLNFSLNYIRNALKIQNKIIVILAPLNLNDFNNLVAVCLNK